MEALLGAGGSGLSSVEEDVAARIAGALGSTTVAGAAGGGEPFPVSVSSPGLVEDLDMGFLSEMDVCVRVCGMLKLV